MQIYSRITRSRVLNGELYTQRLQKLIYPKDYNVPSEVNLSIFVYSYKYKQINFCNLCVYDAIYMLLTPAWDPCLSGYACLISDTEEICLS